MKFCKVGGRCQALRPCACGSPRLLAWQRGDRHHAAGAQLQLAAKLRGSHGTTLAASACGMQVLEGQDKDIPEFKHIVLRYKQLKKKIKAIPKAAPNAGMHLASWAPRIGA